MKVKVKRQQLVEMIGAINSLVRIKGTVRFAYALAKNKKLIGDEVELMKEGLKPSPELIEFDKQRTDLCELYAEKDEKGKPKIVNNNYAGLDNHEEFNKKIIELKEKFKVALDTRTKQGEDFNKMLQEEIEFEFWDMYISDIPDNITAEMIGPLLPIILEKPQE